MEIRTSKVSVACDVDKKNVLVKSCLFVIHHLFVEICVRCYIATGGDIANTKETDDLHRFVKTSPCQLRTDVINLPRGATT